MSSMRVSTSSASTSTEFRTTAPTSNRNIQKTDTLKESPGENKLAQELRDAFKDQNSKRPKTEYGIDYAKDDSSFIPDDFMLMLEEGLSELTDDILSELQLPTSSKPNQPAVISSKAEVSSKLAFEKQNPLLNSYEERKPGPSKRIIKARERYKARKQTRQEINAAKINENPDAGSYIMIEIDGNPIQGAVDRGTSVTCLGKGCLEFVQKANLNIYPFKYNINTVDGRTNEIIGLVRANVKYNSSTTSVVNMYLVPTLKLDLSIGQNLINILNVSYSK